MRQIREILRLKWELGLSVRQVALSCGLSRPTVTTYVQRAEACGLSWPLPASLDDAQLERMLYPPRSPAAFVPGSEPDWPTVHRELKRKGVTLQICRYRHICSERLLRDPVIGRRLSFGSDSKIGAHLTALMYSVIGPLNLNGIDVLRWLDAWLMACAENGGQPPDDLAPWLPWSMDDARRRELTAPG